MSFMATRKMLDERAAKELRDRLIEFVREQEFIKLGVVKMLDLSEKPFLYQRAIHNCNDLDVRIDEQRVVVCFECLQQEHDHCKLHFRVNNIVTF